MVGIDVGGGGGDALIDGLAVLDAQLAGGQVAVEVEVEPMVADGPGDDAADRAVGNDGVEDDEGAFLPSDAGLSAALAADADDGCAPYLIFASFNSLCLLDPVTMVRRAVLCCVVLCCVCVCCVLCVCIVRVCVLM